MAVMSNFGKVSVGVGKTLQVVDGQKYVTLQAEYDVLNVKYNSLDSNYSNLQNEYEVLDASYSALSEAYTIVDASYQSIDSSYSTLINQYDLLDSSYQTLQTECNELEVYSHILDESFPYYLEEYNDNEKAKYNRLTALTYNYKPIFSTARVKRYNSGEQTTLSFYTINEYLEEMYLPKVSNFSGGSIPNNRYTNNIKIFEAPLLTRLGQSSNNIYFFHGNNTVLERLVLPSLTEMDQFQIDGLKNCTYFEFEGIQSWNSYYSHFPPSYNLSYTAIFGPNLSTISGVVAYSLNTQNNDVPHPWHTYIFKSIVPPSLTTNFCYVDGYGYPFIRIYVPDESVDAYKTSTNWIKVADYIHPMSEYTPD